VRREKGIALLMILAMISLLGGVVMLCAFVLSHEVYQDERHQITRQRMLEVERALIGRLADVGGGGGITSSGGFISDYGEPSAPATFNIGNLLSNLGFTPWAHNDTHYFWAGYHGGRYLNPPPGEAEFRDGWGNIMQVRFIGNQIEIKSWGSDRAADGAIPPTGYGRDIVDTFYWRRGVRVTDKTGIPDVNFHLIYPFRGRVRVRSVHMAPYVFHNIPVGLRKIEVRDGDGILRSIQMVCIPQGASEYSITIN
jgi:hypothetical protein